MLIGGGPIRGGHVIGASDELGYQPKDRPIAPGEVVATMSLPLTVLNSHGLSERFVPAVLQFKLSTNSAARESTTG